MDVDRVAPGIEPEDARRACVGAEQAEQGPDGRGLPGSVGAEEAVDLTRGDGEVESVEGAEPAELLDQAAHRDDS